MSWIQWHQRSGQTSAGYSCWQRGCVCLLRISSKCRPVHSKYKAAESVTQKQFGLAHDKSNTTDPPHIKQRVRKWQTFHSPCPTKVTFYAQQKWAAPFQTMLISMNRNCWGTALKHKQLVEQALTQYFDQNNVQSTNVIRILLSKYFSTENKTFSLRIFL